MDSTDQVGDDRTFKVNFSADGVSKLRETVTEKLREFMGDYTDDILVEYVIVLLRNGRRKDEARKELNVFLGDDSATFVSWLWDHLSSYLHLYVQTKESFPDEAVKTTPLLNEQSGRCNPQQEHLNDNMQTVTEHERERLGKTSRSRHNKDWKGLVREGAEVFPLRSVVTDILHSEEKTYQRPKLARRSRSPRLLLRRKRSREDEQQPTKRESASHPAIAASRRLLQFAVRDAVRTVQQPSSRTEPALKRLRSVVSVSTTESVQEKGPQRTKSVARASGALSTALRAAAEAAEDVIKVRSSGSVFDRLGHGIDPEDPIYQPSEPRTPELEDGEYEDFGPAPLSTSLDYHHRGGYNGDIARDMTMLDKETSMAVDSASDNDGYSKAGIIKRGVMDASQTASSVDKDKSLMLECSVAQDADVVRKTRYMEQDPPASSAMTSSKIVNISVNVNTWKPPHYQVPRDVAQVENRMAVEKGDVNSGKPNVRTPKKNDVPTAENVKEMEHADVQKEPQKISSTHGSYAAGRPSEDVDSRTLFVSNVHFAATKDTLSRHFNKFGAVLKVIIMTDPATGQPTGSAYVEFLRKESAELALSLNGTSFMSRILKVVWSSSHEASPMLGWPRIARASPFASRLGRTPYPRGVLPGAFRARLPIKPGARSLQWKREGSTAQPTEGLKCPPSVSITSGNNVLSPTARSLTYTRTEAKADGSSTPT